MSWRADLAYAVEVTGTTSAVANTETTVALVGPPPAGVRYRVVGLAVLGDSASTQPVLARVRQLTTLRTAVVAGGPPAPTVDTVVLPGGLRLEGAVGLELVVVSPGTSVPFRAIAYLVEEPV